MATHQTEEPRSPLAILNQNLPPDRTVSPDSSVKVVAACAQATDLSSLRPTQLSALAEILISTKEPSPEHLAAVIRLLSVALPEPTRSRDYLGKLGQHCATLPITADEALDILHEVLRSNFHGINDIPELSPWIKLLAEKLPAEGVTLVGKEIQKRIQAGELSSYYHLVELLCSYKNPECAQIEVQRIANADYGLNRVVKSVLEKNRRLQDTKPHRSLKALCIDSVLNVPICYFMGLVLFDSPPSAVMTVTMAIVLSATRSFLEPSAAWRDLPEIKEADVRKHKKCCNALEHFKDVAIPRFEKNAYRNF